MFKVDLIVRPRPGVRDPQGEAVQEALVGLGYERVSVQAVGRTLHLELDATDAAEAKRITDDICKRLLVNPNLETYEAQIRRA